MQNTVRLLDPWMLIGEAAVLLLMLLAVFVWNSPRRRQPAELSRTSTGKAALTTASGAKAP